MSTDYLVRMYEDKKEDGLLEWELFEKWVAETRALTEKAEEAKAEKQKAEKELAAAQQAYGEALEYDGDKHGAYRQLEEAKQAYEVAQHTYETKMRHISGQHDATLKLNNLVPDFKSTYYPRIQTELLAPALKKVDEALQQFHDAMDAVFELSSLYDSFLNEFLETRREAHRGGTFVYTNSSILDGIGNDKLYHLRAIYNGTERV